jgi:phosphonate transport system substrate-binding protein
VGVCLLVTLFFPRVFPAFSEEAPVGLSAPRYLGVVGFYNPRLMYVKYQRLVDYLTETTGDRWELAVTMDYQETVQALCSGRLDMAYLGPFTYLRVHEACGAMPVVRLNTKGSATFRSLIMVRQDSPYRMLSDLEGAVVAFGSPLSTSSHLVPSLMLRDAGLKPGADFICRYFGHHDRAARAVVLGTADACGVRDIVGERFAKRGLRILARSDPIPNFPLVVRPGASPEFRKSLVEALMERPEHDPEIRKRMQDWDEELAGGFAPVSASDYLPVRRLVEQLFGRRGLVDPPQLLKCGGKD